MVIVLEQDLADDNDELLPDDLVDIQDIPEFGIGYARLPQNRMGKILAPQKPHYFVVLPESVQRECREKFRHVSVGTTNPNPRIEPADYDEFIDVDPELDVSENALKKETFFMPWKLTSLEPGTQVTFKGYVTNSNKSKAILDAVNDYLSNNKILWNTLYKDNKIGESLDMRRGIIVLCAEED